MAGLFKNEESVLMINLLNHYLIRVVQSTDSFKRETLQKRMCTYATLRDTGV